MKEIIITPSKVRGLGNIITDITKDSYEAHHCNIEEIGTLTQNNIDIPLFNIKLKGISTYLTVESLTSILPNEEITFDVTLKDLDENLVSRIDVYFYENDVLLGTAETVSGECSFSYTPTGEGQHNVKIKTFNQLDYDSTEIIKEFFVYRSPTLSISHTPDIPEILENVSLFASLENNGVPVVGKTIQFYDGETLLGEGTTDNNGLALFTYENGG